MLDKFADKNSEWRDSRVLEAGDTRKTDRFWSTARTGGDRAGEDGAL